MKWRLGLDLGTNSLGWAALELEADGTGYRPVHLVDCGSRIFSDGRNPKDKQSNAVKRREPRGARKNRDRYKRRRTRLMRELVEFGLMPDNEAARKALEGGKGTALTDSDPWILRTRALDEEISPHQIGRAIFHLHQRRGFKSNRKTDRADSDSGKVYEATKRTREKLEAEGARTLGELFGRPRLEAIEYNQTAPKGEKKPQPLARVRKSGEGAKWQYDYYPTRALVLEEFDRIWQSQKGFHSDVYTDEAGARLRDTIEWQHPLKSPPVGKCTLLPEEERAAKALPSFAKARIFQEVNALQISPAGKAKKPLTLKQRNQLTARLLHPTSKTAKVSFDQMRNLLKLSTYDKFNTESEKRSWLVGDETAAAMMQKDRWGPGWFDLDLKDQDEIIAELLDQENEDALVDFLCTKYGLDAEQALRVADCPLPDGYGNLSKKALDQILPPLEQKGLVYSEAVEAAGLGSHSQFGTGEVFDRTLPYYGYILERSVAFGTGEPSDPDEKRYGKIANPTVHVALNQLRAVVNDLLKRFGPPEEIVVELARDLPYSAKKKSDLKRKQDDNQQANEARRKRLREEFHQRDSYENRMRLRLYEDLEALGKRCIYTGEQIGAHNLFSDEVEIEHILPFSRTFDDGYNNKTLSMRRANRDKLNKSPYDAFGHSPDEYDWEEISKRADELPPGKRWRFEPDAMERFETDGGFLARQLTDTQYISRLAKGYLEAIYPGGKASNVWVVPGRLTADLRWQWGLDSVLRGHNEDTALAQKKNRHDHRHHAIDALVVACTDRGMLQKAAKQAQQNEALQNGRLMHGIEEPWTGFRTEAEKYIRAITVSHKPDHGVEAAMHNDTAYGFLKDRDKNPVGPDKKGRYTVFTRKPLDSDSFKSVKDLGKIRDKKIKQELETSTFGLSGTDFKEALLSAAQAMTPPVYKVRIEDTLKVIPITNKSGKTYKAYKGDGNYCYDIWVSEKGKWVGEVISTFDAYQLSRENPNWWRGNRGRNDQKLVMRLRKNDYVAVSHDGRCLLAQIYKFSVGKINMAEHFEANASARMREKSLPAICMSPSSLQKAGAKRVTVSPSGVVKTYGNTG
jgi:CRISPR-associated endonuclease Csn1